MFETNGRMTREALAEVKVCLAAPGSVRQGALGKRLISKFGFDARDFFSGHW